MKKLKRQLTKQAAFFKSYKTKSFGQAFIKAAGCRRTYMTEKVA
ncbi:MAG TPA: hypothetical protein VN626_09175 [Clostridia bacterium]|nr:hypothetical protein [Clostridia bacterium]